MESEREGDYVNQFVKSYLDGVRSIKLDILECCPELEKLIGMDKDGQEVGGWSFYDSEWRLKDGKTAADVVRILLANSDCLQDITKTLAIIKINDEGGFSSQDGKVFYSGIMLILPPIRLIRALLNSPFLSIFECLFLIGYDRENNAINNSVHIANNAISKGIISPRDPNTNLKCDECPAIRLNGDMVTPDLSWLLTFEEAEAWAFNSFGVSLKALRDRLPTKPVAQTVNSTEHPTDTQTTDNSEQVELSGKPTYLDENNPMFSRELFIAIEAWEQVLSSNPNKPKTGSRKGLILAWLDKNHKELTTQAKERIATMINPDSNGGTPKTQAL